MEWISVQDRLPGYGRSVLFCTVDGSSHEGVKTAYGWTAFRWGAMYYDSLVTHWMPMPKPPKEVLP